MYEIYGHKISEVPSLCQYVFSKKHDIDCILLANTFNLMYIAIKQDRNNMLKLRKYRILELAEARGYKNQNELAKSLDILPQSLSQLLGNKRNFTKETLEKLLTCLDCEIEDLIEKNFD